MNRLRTAWGAFAGTALLLCASAALADDDVVNSGDTAWILTSSALVLLMTLPGLALFYGGLVRSKNILSVLMQCLISAAAIGVLWVLVGYSLAFGEGNSVVGDLSMFGLRGITPDSVSGSMVRSLLTVANPITERTMPNTAQA